MISKRKHDKFANKKWKGVISEKIKAKTCFADKDLSSWTGLGRSGHDRSQSFGPISHVSGPKLTLKKNPNKSAWFCVGKLKNKFLLLFFQKLHLSILITKFIMFLKIMCFTKQIYFFS